MDDCNVYVSKDSVGEKGRNTGWIREYIPEEEITCC
jgi:hypothetical protein